MPRITELTFGLPSTPALELETIVYLVQSGASRQLLLSDMLAARQPASDVLTDLVTGIPPTGDGVLTRLAGVWSLEADPFGGLYELAGTSAAGISAHNADPAAHSSVATNFAAHEGFGGVAKHPVATLVAAGFAPIRSGVGTDYLSGLGTYLPLPLVATPTSRIAEGTASIGIDTYYVVALTVGNATLNLPQITALNDGHSILVKVRTLLGFSVTLQAYNAGDGTDKIDAANTLVMTTDYSMWTLVACFDAGGDSFWSKS